MALLQILHAALRPLLTETVGNDNVDQLFFAQTLAAGYAYEQPPLYTWLVWGIAQILGPTVVTLGLVRYALVFLIHLFAYLAGRKLLCNPRLQVACGLSPLLLYPIGWRLHEADTMGVLASVLVLALVWVFLRILRRGRIGDFLGFGLLLGLGLLSSGWMPIGLAALFLAVLMVRSARGAFYRPPLLLSLVLAGLIVLPTALWILDAGSAFFNQVAASLADWHKPEDLNPWYLRAWFGFVNLFVGAFPNWLILGLLFLPSLLPLPRGSLQDGGRVLLLYCGLLLLLSPLAAVLFDIDKAHQFRLYPLTLPFLPLFFRRLELHGVKETALRWLFILYAVFILVAIQARFQHIEAGPAFCAKCRMQTPYPAFAGELGAEGYSGRGTIVAGDIHIAGNFRASFPDARILTPRYPEVRPPLRGAEGPCLVVWSTAEGKGHVATLYSFLEVLGADLPPSDRAERHILKIPLPARIDVPQRQVVLDTILLPHGSGDCR
ncbi:MAG: glycosyltransferase family 39 protein [Rhodospirillales bacterium]|nr:glycosyltransferase family 39 protein [Rhodospirillales bacterium]